MWIGRDPNKGLAVFSFNHYEVRLPPSVDDRLRWIAPVEVSGPASFRLLAVWAMNHRARDAHPERPNCPDPMAALDAYKDWMPATPS